MSNIYFYYYNIIPRIERTCAIAPKSDDDVGYVQTNSADGAEYVVKYTEAGNKKYRESLVNNYENSISSASDEELEKVANEIISSDWHCEMDENGIVKLWAAFDSEGIAIKHERLIRERFDGIYHHLKEQGHIHKHIFSSLEEGLPIFFKSSGSKKALDIKKVCERICKKYVKTRDALISSYIIRIPETKDAISEFVNSTRTSDRSFRASGGDRISQFINSKLPLWWRAIEMHNKLWGYKQPPENIIWTQEYLEAQLQNALDIEIKADRRNTLLKLWISKLSDMQNSIKFAFQALALTFVVCFNLNAAVRFVVNFFYDSVVKNFYRIVISNDFFLFCWVVISFLIAGFVFAYITKKEIRLLLKVINI